MQGERVSYKEVAFRDVKPVDLGRWPNNNDDDDDDDKVLSV